MKCTVERLKSHINNFKNLNDQAPTGTITFLFSDIEDSTKLWEQYHEEMKTAQAKHDAILKDVIASNHGHSIKTTGDGVHAVFATALNGINATITAQRQLYSSFTPALAPGARYFHAHAQHSFQKVLQSELGHIARHTGSLDEAKASTRKPSGPGKTRAIVEPSPINWNAMLLWQSQRKIHTAPQNYWARQRFYARKLNPQ